MSESADPWREYRKRRNLALFAFFGYFSWIDAKQNNHAALRYQGRFYKYDHPRGKNETLAFKLNNYRQIVGDVLFGPAFLATY